MAKHGNNKNHHIELDSLKKPNKPVSDTRSPEQKQIDSYFGICQR